MFRYSLVTTPQRDQDIHVSVPIEVGSVDGLCGVGREGWLRLFALPRKAQAVLLTKDAARVEDDLAEADDVAIAITVDIEYGRVTGQDVRGDDVRVRWCKVERAIVDQEFGRIQEKELLVDLEEIEIAAKISSGDPWQSEGNWRRCNLLSAQ